MDDYQPKFEVPPGLEGLGWNKLMVELDALSKKQFTPDGLGLYVRMDPEVARYLYGLLAKPKGQ